MPPQLGRTEKLARGGRVISTRRVGFRDTNHRLSLAPLPLFLGVDLQTRLRNPVQWHFWGRWCLFGRNPKLASPIQRLWDILGILAMLFGTLLHLRSHCLASSFRLVAPSIPLGTASQAHGRSTFFLVFGACRLGN